jgi:subtilisin-like proprotein convertase family protein
MSRFRLIVRFLVPMAVVAAWLPVLGASPVAAGGFPYAFTNSNPITIPSSGPASPYPSSITVSGVPAVASTIVVQLTNINHAFSSDVDILLRGPLGQTVVLISDTGGSGAWVGVTLELNDDASQSLPTTTVDTPSGAYRPTNFSDGVPPSDSYPSPAPPGPYGSALAAFEGKDPNGTWHLFVVDDDPGAAGAIYSWTIFFDVVQMSTGDVSVTEGDSGTLNMIFGVFLSSQASFPIFVDFVTADGTAKSPTDYEGRSGTRVFFPGQTHKRVSIAISGDTAQEGNETLFLRLRDAEGATLTDDSALGTIVDNDAPTISVNDVSQTEANSGTNKTYAFKVTLSKPGTNTITVQYATANGTAVAPGDYTAKALTTLTFSPGVVSKTVNVTVKGDNLDEANEVFYLNLSNATNATIADGQGMGTIVDND